MMRRALLAALLVLMAAPAWALRVMTDDRVIASQERRFMEGSEWILIVMGLVMFIGMGLIQFGIPHALMVLCRRLKPSLHPLHLRLIGIGSCLAIWLIAALFFFGRPGRISEHLTYLLAAFVGYLSIKVPCRTSGWVRQRQPKMWRIARWSISLLLFSGFMLLGWGILWLMTESALMRR